MAVRIEDAGFEIRDMIAWVYGSGFPKSLDVSKAIDKAAGAEREVVGRRTRPDGTSRNYEDWNGKESTNSYGDYSAFSNITAPATEAAKQWEGWGSALKPAFEPITVARKPLEGTVAENVLEWGTGGLNIDGCRVGMRDENESGWSKTGSKAGENRSMSGANYEREPKDEAGNGRWPANLIHDGSEEVLAGFPVTKTNAGTARKTGESASVFGNVLRLGTVCSTGDSGSAARFFYCAKASKRDRDEGCEGLEKKTNDFNRASSGLNQDKPGREGRNPNTEGSRNHHPTVKPTDLMRYLCRLVTPLQGTVLDPFMGSGSTGKAAVLEGFDFIGIEREAEYMEIAKARIEHVSKQPKQGELDLD
jgi:site-specific DNA-methyltransferase (adenine-specific)